MRTFSPRPTLKEGQTYLGENVLQYQEEGPTRLGTEGGDWVNVFDEGQTKGEAGAKGASGASFPAAIQESLLNAESVKGGKALFRLKGITKAFGQSASIASFGLSTGPEFIQAFTGSDNFGTYERVKGVTDAVFLYGSTTNFIRAGLAFGAEVSGLKRFMVRQATLEILESQVDVSVGPDPTLIK